MDWDDRMKEVANERRTPYVIAEDGHHFQDGDEVYNYYDMWPGKIQMFPEDVELLADPACTRRQRASGVWFYVKHLDGSTQALLNGQRICSREFARMKDWPGA
jgi:hypothetical protein